MTNVSLSQNGGNSILSSALLIYTEGERFTSNRTISHMTEHRVQIHNGQPIIMEGSAFTLKSMREMARHILKKKDEVLQFVEENVLAISDTEIVWWIPSSKRNVHFKTSTPGLENRCGQVQIPSCIFAVTSNGSYVLCFEGTERPTKSTTLHYSPFFNVWDNHQICLGSTRKVKHGDVQAWTNAFFSSAFSHSNYRSSKADLLREGGRKQLWMDLLDNKIQEIPFDCLPSAKLTLSQFLKEISS